MKLKPMVRYQMNFTGKAAEGSGLMMGVAFFLRVLYFLAFQDLKTVTAWQLTAGLIVPLVFITAYVVMLRIVKINAPGLYGIFGAVYCLLMIIGDISFGTGIHVAISVVWYLLAAVVLLATVGGYIPWRIIAFFCFFLSALIRFLVVDLKKYIMSKAFIAFLPEAAALAGLLGVAFLALSIRKNRE